MELHSIDELVKNIDARLTRAEQILPTLATKGDLAAAIVPLATKAELAAAIAPLATKGELAAAIAPLATKAELAAAIAPLATKAELAAAIAPLATKAELAAAIAPLATKAELAVEVTALRVEIREEGHRTRGHFDAVAERLESQIRLIAEGLVALRERMDDRFEHVGAQIAGLDRRVMRLEATRGL